MRAELMLLCPAGALHMPPDIQTGSHRMTIWLLILLGLFGLNIYYTPRLLRLVPCLVVAGAGLVGLYWLWAGEWELGALSFAVAALSWLGLSALCRRGTVQD